MNMDEVFAEIDRLYTANESAKAEEYILDKVSEAAQTGDENAMIQLLNELIGHYRETSEFDKMKLFAEKLLAILEGSDLKGSQAHATSLLNVANAYRAAGLLKESNALYQEVKSYYDAHVAPDSMLYASLLNNMALLFQEMGDYESAADCLERALGISLRYPECRIEQATTYANLATTLIKLDRLDEAEAHLAEAFELFELDEEPDYHYSAALSAMGEIKYIKKEYDVSAEYYEKALDEIEKCVGRSRAYEITKQNMEAALAKMNESRNPSDMSGIEISRAYYEKYGKPMIHEKFSEYENRIAVGLAGEGSECFGFDDKISRDHDFGPGFCMWLAKEDYKKIGKKLQKEYDRLPKEFMGISRLETEKAGKRTGVYTVGKFYRKYLGIKRAPKTNEEWLAVDETGLAHAVNGEVFVDELGGFSYIRNKLKEYYPDPVWRCRIAQAAALMSQTGQYNYPRMLQRGDLVTASVYMSEFIKNTMQMLYLLNRQYSPYIKWMYKGIAKLEDTGDIPAKIDKLVMTGAGGDGSVEIIEDICTEILGRLSKIGLAEKGDNYLDHHTGEILYGSSVSNNISDRTDTYDREAKEKLIEKIIALEWKAFDRVENQGGRASCQDDWQTFSIMRKSQYMLWDREMLASFINDFEEANARGWNLITEKYGRMEETTAPEEYAKIKDNMPPIDDEKKKIIEAIVGIQVGMMEEFAKDYPKAAGEARSIHTSEDTPFNTSYETYLRGEISTYSDMTLGLYGRFVARMAKEGRNIAKETITNSALLYGYASLDDMEQKL
ncbi:MAG: DUF4125 family protein [Lachnospiraceae bacterium]|nr:DUF4125 family protein [Lachnospiraceae bacterium]